LTDLDFLCLVAVQEGDVVGLLYGIVTEHFFADMCYATNVMLYVAPEARGSWAVVKLIRRFERESRARGADEILIGNTSGINAARTVQLYARLGYHPVGANAVKYSGE
jgi:GNAT superfamily N-acetyltransferase